jgi:hypothetical protein
MLLASYTPDLMVDTIHSGYTTGGARRHIGGLADADAVQDGERVAAGPRPGAGQ